MRVMTRDGDGPSTYLATRYSTEAAAYDEVWSPVIRPAGEALIHAMDLGSARRILDAGVGAGALAAAIRSTAPEAIVLGLDLSQGMLELAVRREGLSCALGDAMALPIAAGTIDAVVLAYVLFHLRRPDAALREAARVLRPGGQVGTVTWADEGGVGAGAVVDAALADVGAPATPWSGDHHGLDSPSAVQRLLESVGLAPTAVWTVALEHQFTLDAFWRLRVSGGNSGWRLRQLEPADRTHVLRSIRRQLEGLATENFRFTGKVVLAAAERA